MTTLRNRALQKNVPLAFGYIARNKSHTFSQSNEQYALKKYQAFLNDIETRLPQDLPFKDKLQFLKNVRSILCSHTPIIDFFVKHPNLIDQFQNIYQSAFQQLFKQIGNDANQLTPELINQFDQALQTGMIKLKNSLSEKASKKYDEYSLSSFFYTTGKMLAANAFSSYFPAMATLTATTALLSPVVAKGAELVVHSGQPDGGLDLCSGILFGCIQGYLTNGTDEPWIAQFNRVVTQVNSKDAQAGAYEQFKDCLDANTVGNLAAESIMKSASDSQSICLGESTIWQGYQATSQITNMPTDSCIDFKNTFAAEAQGCQSLLGSAKYSIMWTGILLGGVGALALCAGAYFGCRIYGPGIIEGIKDKSIETKERVKSCLRPGNSSPA